MMRFLRNCDGGVAPLMALGAIPLVIGVGAAVDYSRGNAGRTAMQAALDAAAIMAAKQSISAGQLTDDVQSYFNANFTRSDIKNLQVSANSSSNNGGGTTYSLTARGTLQTDFMSLTRGSHHPALGHFRNLHVHRRARMRAFSRSDRDRRDQPDRKRVGQSHRLQPLR